MASHEQLRSVLVHFPAKCFLLPSRHASWILLVWSSACTDPLLACDVVDPLNRTFSFHLAGCFYNLVKLSSYKKFIFYSSDPEATWLGHFLSYLASTGYTVPWILPTLFTSSLPRRRAKFVLLYLDLPEALPTSNSFDVLSSVPPPAPFPPPVVPDPSPRMVFKHRVPPISIKLTSDTTLSLVKSILHDDTILLYLQDRIRIQASSLEEYNAILSLAAHHHVKFFTHNPTVTQISKSVLRSLPCTTSTDDIQQAFSALNRSIPHVRQM